MAISTRQKRTAGPQPRAARHATSRRSSAQALPDAARLRRAFGLNRSAFERLCGFSQRILAEWESGRRRPGEQGRRRLVELDRLRSALGRVVRTEAIPDWLQSPNPAFGGLKPLEVIERGETDRLWQMVYFLEAGEPA